MKANIFIDDVEDYKNFIKSGNVSIVLKDKVYDMKIDAIYNNDCRQNLNFILELREKE